MKNLKAIPKFVKELSGNISSQERGYINRCFDTLKKYSSKKDLQKVDDYMEIINEWIFIPSDDNFRESFNSVCELCGQPNRYQFCIHNSLTGNHLWLGTSCILNMDFPFFKEEMKNKKTVNLKQGVLNSFISRKKEYEKRKRAYTFSVTVSLGTEYQDYFISSPDKKLSEKDYGILKHLYNQKLGFDRNIIKLPDWLYE